MDTINQEKISQLINSLTVNEDIRQDLWIAYLSGTPANKLSSKILQILISYDIEERSVKTFTLSSAQESFFNAFSDLESRVMYLLSLGYNVGEISVALGRSRVAILQAVSSMRKNIAWDLYGIKEKLQ